MTIRKDRTKAFLNELEKRLTKGIEEGLQHAEEAMVRDYSQAISPPTSGPGEFPHIDSGQLVNNIDSGMAAGKPIRGGVGVKGRNTDEAFLGNRIEPENIGGLHAFFLSHGNPAGNPYVVNGVRLGIDDSFMQNREQIKTAIEKGATR